MTRQAGDYSGLINIKRLGVFRLLSGWDASPSQGYPFIHLSEGNARVKCVAQERNAEHGQGSSPDNRPYA